FFRLDVFGQLGGHGFEFLLVQLHTHDGILLKRLLSHGQLHNLVYRLIKPALCAHSDITPCTLDRYFFAEASDNPCARIHSSKVMP
ncbi:hypothetical protein, partial [Pseudomonas sp.]|uniref:hypothetical protein n=1 Tax=Pseudomonas sp. TaxID=306 RepID=UPI00405426E0